ncbi:MAG TPA: hypothetical protein PK668_22435 [Myxococcota bacterium]|nr:hypothetical protein [Myxococcota bacterium]HRY96266.1 hypothetical protein [Myxococcota bacterium]HSA20442.1 hypothetical protein [Myxococcota bacterium]
MLESTALRAGLAALALACWLPACSSGSDPKPCTTDLDCAADQYCGPDGRCLPRLPDGGDDGADQPADGQDGADGTDGVDPGPPPCQRDTDCPADEVCDEASGTCGAGQGCNADYNCNIDTEFCDPEGKVCKTRSALCEPCARALECLLPSEGDLCISYPGGLFCGQRCGTLACPAGYVCDLTAGSGTGPNPGQCRSNTGDCAGTFICHGDGDCAANKVCNLATGTCVGKCTSDVNCAAGLKCHYTGHCGPPCSTDADCGGELICCTPGRGFCDAASTGKCRPEGCVLHSECLLTVGDSLGYCDRRTNECKTGCREANPQNVNDCKSGMKCECTGGALSCDQFDCCPDPGGVCLCDPELEDCSQVSVCDDGQCIEIPCQERGDVSVACARNQVCCGWPLADGYPCPAGTPTGECYTAVDPVCRTCADNAACEQAGYGFGEKPICLDDSDGNKYCHLGCRNSQDCPATWACDYSFIQGCEDASNCTGAATCEVVDRSLDGDGQVQEALACICASEADCEPDFDGFAPHCLPMQACDRTVDPIQCHEVKVCHYAKACQCSNCCGQLAAGG